MQTINRRFNSAEISPNGDDCWAKPDNKTDSISDSGEEWVGFQLALPAKQDEGTEADYKEIGWGKVTFWAFHESLPAKHPRDATI